MLKVKKEKENIKMNNEQGVYPFQHYIGKTVRIIFNIADEWIGKVSKITTKDGKTWIELSDHRKIVMDDIKDLLILESAE